MAGQITFNRPLGEDLMERLLEAYKKGFGIHCYKPKTHAPQHLFIPTKMRRGGLRWRNWLARAAASDYRTQSTTHYKTHAALHAKRPGLYNHEAANYMPQLIEHILRAEGFSKWRAMTHQVRILSDTFERFLEGDPLNLYGRGSIEELMKFKSYFKRQEGYDGIFGFGPKIASLYAIFLEEEGLVRIEDALPVDVWIQQIFLATGIIVVDGPVYASTLEDEIRLFLCELCARKAWSRVDLAHALWFLGNKGCKNCYRSKDMEIACVLWEGCRGRAISLMYRGYGRWMPDQHYRKGGDRDFKLAPIPDDSPQLPLFGKD